MRLVDRVAYINHDIDDALRYGLLAAEDLPRAELELLGEKGSARIDTLVHDLIESSERAGDIVQSEEVGRAMLTLRSFMFERVYLGDTRAASTSAPTRPSGRSSTTSSTAATPRTRSAPSSPA